MTKDEAAKVRFALSELRKRAFPQHHPIIDGILANLKGAEKDAMIDRSNLERAVQDFSELRGWQRQSRNRALAIVTGRYGVSAEDVLRAQAEADTRYATNATEDS